MKDEALRIALQLTAAAYGSTGDHHKMLISVMLESILKSTELMDKVVDKDESEK